jgi:hypothetical protein
VVLDAPAARASIRYSTSGVGRREERLRVPEPQRVPELVQGHAVEVQRRVDHTAEARRQVGAHDHVLALVVAAERNPAEDDAPGGRVVVDDDVGLVVRRQLVADVRERDQPAELAPEDAVPRRDRLVDGVDERRIGVRVVLDGSRQVCVGSHQ